MKAVVVHLIVFCSIFLHAEVSAQTILSGAGRVNMEGAIIDTACDIVVGSREQEIDVGQVRLVDIIRDGKGRSRNFSIELVNCVPWRSNKIEWKKFRIIFEGDAEEHLFGVLGEASGVGLQILAPQGYAVIPGLPLPIDKINPGNMKANYTLQLVANNKPLKCGFFSSSIRFILDYF
ncbi:fimbrial protein [Enterobacter huaxiensis]